MVQMSKELGVTVRMPDIQRRKVTSKTLTVENRFTVHILSHILYIIVYKEPTICNSGSIVY